jgi:MFS family permease
MSTRVLSLLFALFLGCPPVLDAAQGENRVEVRSGDSLWRIYARLPEQAGLNRQAWMVAVQRLNPAAFRNPCAARSLKPGAQLLLPSANWVEAISANRAALELARQERAAKQGDAIRCSSWFDALTSSAQQTPEILPGQTIGEPVAERPVPSTGEKTTESAAVPGPVQTQGPPESSAEVTTAADGPPGMPAGESRSTSDEDTPKELEAPVPEPRPKPQVSPGEAETEVPLSAPGGAWKQAPPASPAPGLGSWSWIGLVVLPLLLWMIVRRFAKAGAVEKGEAQTTDPVYYRNRIMWLVTLTLVIGQGIYAVYNVSSFQRNYLASIQAQSQRLGTLLRQDIEYVLKLGIPIEKLIKIETSLAEVLEATPEIEFIEITDLQDRVIYFADHQTMEQVEGLSRLSRTRQSLGESDGLLALSREDTDIRIPINNPRTQASVGFIQMRISAGLVQGTSREIVWDIVTVILVSLLISFEVLGFFVGYSFSEPLRRLSRAVALAVPGRHPVVLGKNFPLPKVGHIVEQLNASLDQLAQARAGFSRRAEHLRESRDSAEREVEQRIWRLSGLAGQSGHAALGQGLEKLQGQWRNWLAQVRRLRDGGITGAISKTSAVGGGELTPHRFIRPFVFLYFVAYNLPVSFFPLFVRTLHEPLWGLPQEVLISLPISVFMLFFAVSMLLAGVWLDRAGWYRPLLFGASIFSLGFAMTAFADSYIELIGYRAITGIGLGIGFMGFQQFVIENTDIQERSIGLASFIGAFFAGEITGTVVGGMLADRLGYANVFLLASAVAFASLLGLLFFFGQRIRTSKKPARSNPKVPLSTFLSALRDREFLAVVLFQAIPAKIALVGFLMYFVPLYLSDIGTSQSDIGRIAMTYALMLIFLGPLVSRWFNEPRYRRYMVLTGGLITGIAMLSFHWLEDSLAILMLVMALGIAHAFSLSSQASLIVETSLVKRLGTGVGMGVYRLWERTGNVIGPFVVATLVATGGYHQAVVWLGAGTVLLSILYLIALPSHARKGDIGETAVSQPQMMES